MAKHKKIKNKLTRSEKEAKKQTRNNQIAAIILAVLMSASLAGVVLSGFNDHSKGQDYVYGNYKFELEKVEGTLQSMFVTKVGDQEVKFYTMPQDTLNLNVEGNLSFLRTSPYLVLSTNPNDNLMSFQDILRFDMSQSTGITVIGGILELNENVTEYPLITCLNASNSTPVIELRESNETNIIVSKNCVKINSTPSDIVYIRDRLLYQMTGILN